MRRPAAAVRAAIALACALARAAVAAEPGVPSSEAEAAGAAPASEPGGRAVAGDEYVLRLPRTEAAADPTAAATVIDARRFPGELKSVAELVSTAPGVAVQDYGGLGHLSTVSIRGSTAQQAKVLLDGIPLGAGGGAVDLSSIPRAWIDRIEVVRGAEGAHYGAGALGGVVNVVTRPAAAGAWSVEAGGGSFYTYTTSGDAAFGGDGWGALAAATVEGTGGAFPYQSNPTPEAGGVWVDRVRENNAVHTGGLLAKAWCAVGAGRVDALAQVSGGRRELPGWPQPTPSDRQDDARGAAALRLTQPLAGDLLLSGGLRGRYDRLDVAIRQLGPGWTSQRDGAGAATFDLAWAHPGGTLTGAATAGVERLTGDGIGAHDRSELAVSLAEDAGFLEGRLRVAPAVRFEKTGGYGGVSGKLGSTFRLARPLSIRGSVGRTFRAPSLAELYLQQGILEPNPDLASEEAWTGDLAVVTEGPLGLAGAGVFASAYRDLIVYAPGSFQRLKPYNDGKARVSGVEVEAASAPARRLLGLSGALAYTYLATETLRGAPEVVGKDLPYRPRHRLYARAALEQPAWSAHAEVHWVGPQFHDPENARPIPSTTTVNAGLSVRVVSRPETRVALEVKNLLDDRRLVDAFGTPLPSRTVLVTVRLSSPARGSSP